MSPALYKQPPSPCFWRTFCCPTLTRLDSCG